MHHEERISEELRQAATDPAGAARELELEILRKNLAEMAGDPPAGATGRFPGGQLTENDEGELRFQIGRLQGKVVVNFGKPVQGLGLSADQALKLATLLRGHANAIKNEEFRAAAKARRAGKAKR